MADKIGTDEYGEILIYQTDDGQTNIEVKLQFRYDYLSWIPY